MKYYEVLQGGEVGSPSSVPKPLKVPSLARSVSKPLKVPSLARSVTKPQKCLDLHVLYQSL